MTARRPRAAVVAVLLAITLLGGVAVVAHGRFFSPRTVFADFTSAIGVYRGDNVKVAGVRVGTIHAVEPRGESTRLTLRIDREIPVPAEVKAIIVAQNLVSARYVQLTPAYVDSGPRLPDGAVIPIARTAVPVEWDEVKTQLTRLAADLGPDSGRSATATSRFIDSAANALGDGNAQRLRETLAQLSGVGRILADGSGDITTVVENLQALITTLRSSAAQVVEFQGRLATLTSVLDGSKSDLDAALTNVSDVVADVERFIRTARDPVAEQIRSLAGVTQTVVDQQKDLEQILHVGPTSIANTLNMFDPRDGGATGTFTFSNLSNPVEFLCGAIGAIENTTAPETSKLCAQYLGPGLSSLSFNYLPAPINPLLASVPPPSDLVYTEPDLMPGAPPGPQPEPVSPALSAYPHAAVAPVPQAYGPLPPGPTGLPALLLPGVPPLAAESPAAPPVGPPAPMTEGTSP